MKFNKHLLNVFLMGLLALPHGHLYCSPENSSPSNRLVRVISQARTGLAHKFPRISQKVTRGVQAVHAHSPIIGLTGFLALIAALYIREWQKNRHLNEGIDSLYRQLNPEQQADQDDLLRAVNRKPRPSLSNHEKIWSISQGIEALSASNNNLERANNELEQAVQDNIKQKGILMLDVVAREQELIQLIEKNENIKNAVTAYLMHIIKNSNRKAGGVYPPVPTRKRIFSRSQLTPDVFQAPTATDTVKGAETFVAWLRSSMRRMPSQIALLLQGAQPPQAPNAPDASGSSHHGNL